MDTMAVFQEDLEASIQSKHAELVRVLGEVRREGKQLAAIGKQCGPAMTFESLIALKNRGRLVGDLCEELITLLQVRRKAELVWSGEREKRSEHGKVITLSLAS